MKNDRLIFQLCNYEHDQTTELYWKPSYDDFDGEAGNNMLFHPDGSVTFKVGETDKGEFPFVVTIFENKVVIRATEDQEPWSDIDLEADDSIVFFSERDITK